jgi:hypothetical protein
MLEERQLIHQETQLWETDFVDNKINQYWYRTIDGESESIKESVKTEDACDWRVAKQHRAIT